MKKTALIIKREYLTRVRKKAFLLTTILFPLLYMGLIFGTSYLGASKQKLKVAVIDHSGYFTDSALQASNKGDSSILFSPVKDTAVRSAFRSLGFDGYIEIPQINWQTGNRNIKFMTDKTHGLGTGSLIETKLNGIWSETINEKLGIDGEMKNILVNSAIGVREENLENKDADSTVSSTIGYVCGFLIYLILLIYGSQVMMGVMEE